MVDVVWRYLSVESARALIEQYRNKGCNIGTDEEVELVKSAHERRKAADERKWERHGEKGDVYVVRLTHKDDGEALFSAGRNDWRRMTARNVRWAKCWRTKKSAEKEAKEWKYSSYDAEVWKVPGEFSAYDGWIATAGY